MDPFCDGGVGGRLDKSLVDDPIVFSSGRMKLISFNRHFAEEEQDKDLKEKLSQPKELSGLLNWCLKGLEDYLSNGIQEPQCVKDDTEAYRQDKAESKKSLLTNQDYNWTGAHTITKYSAYYLCRSNNDAHGTVHSDSIVGFLCWFVLLAAVLR